MKSRHYLKRTRRVALAVALLVAALESAFAQQPAVYENPVVAGDYPDPSVIRVGEDYWATATSGEWAPEFPLLHSRDLVNWEVVGAVFSRRPDWTQGNFWAPEISQYHGRYFIYYTARKRGGPLCVAVASAALPSGPYTDHGPLVCQEIGSIDAAAVTDERGERYLIWKEDGNSRNRPTPIWAQRFANDGTRLTGVKKELIRNDPQSWEGGVVEGAFILRRGEWFYLFYSGNACCGRRCHYALGVARSRKLLGPWEKNPANPILAENQVWQCPGHGSIVSDEEGRDFLLYHAYRQSEEAFYIGREALLDEVKWGAGGWPIINEGRGPSGQSRAPLPLAKRTARAAAFFDDFEGPTLRPGWQWPQANEPSIRLESERNGRLILTPARSQPGDPLSAVLSQPTTSADYRATALLDTSTLKGEALAGLSAYNGREDALGIAAGKGRILIYTREQKRHQTITTVNVPDAPLLYLQMEVAHGSSYRFAYSLDGREWKKIGEEINGSFLEGVRVALTSGGAEGATAKFEWLRITPAP